MKKIFELYAIGEWTLYALADWCKEQGLTGHKDKQIAPSRIHHLLSNPFYCGLFRFTGELHQGTHEALITKDLFDCVQDVQKKRGRARKSKMPSFALLGLMKCGSCGCYVTAERQKGHAYYHCTKKKGPCEEKGYLREEALIEKIQGTLKNHSIPDDWADNMLKEVEREKEAAHRAAQEKSTGIRERVAALPQSSIHS